MNKWEIVKFADCFSDITSQLKKIPKEKYQSSGKYAIIDQGQKSIAGYSDDELELFYDVPVIIFGDHTRILKYVDFPLFIGADGVKVLKPKLQNSCCKYLYYALLSVHIIDTGYNRHFKWLKESVIPLPPLEEQKKIANELDEINDLIAKRKEQIEKLDLLVKAKFIEMFGDPVTNPKGWEVKKLSDASASRLGKMLDAKKETSGEKHPYLANFNVQWFSINLSKLNYMSFDEKEQNEFSLKEGDLLVCEGGIVGRCAIWNEPIKKCFFQKALHRIRCQEGVLSPYYLAWIFNFKSNYNSFSDIVGSQATIAHLTGEKLKKVPLPLPPFLLQDQFADYIKTIEQNKTKLQVGLAQLELLYKQRMQYYFE